MILLEEEPLF